MTADEFKGVDNIGQPELTEIIRDNIITFTDWAFLKLGAYFNISIPTSGVYGGDRHVLKPISDPRYNDGQVWVGYRKNWIWESGVNQATAPISISGIFINNVFSPINSGYYIDYPDGKVVFDTAISLNSEVKLEYSHKWIQIVDADNIPWFREAQYRSLRTDSNNYIISSGIHSNTPQSRIQFPTIAVQTLTDREKLGYEIGNSSEWTRTQVVFHILGEDGGTVDRLADILDKQSQKTIFLFDTGLVGQENKFPLDYRGSVVPGALVYPDLIAPTGDGGYRYTAGVQQGKLRVASTRAQKSNRINQNLYYSTVRWTTEVILLQD